MTDLMTLLTHPAMIIAGVLLGGTALFGLGSALCDEIAARKREHLEREVLQDFDAAVSELQRTTRDDPNRDEVSRQLRDLDSIWESLDTGSRLSRRYRFRPTSIISAGGQGNRIIVPSSRTGQYLTFVSKEVERQAERLDEPASTTLNIAEIYSFMVDLLSAGMLDESSAKTIKSALAEFRSNREGAGRGRATHPEHATTQG